MCEFEKDELLKGIDNLIITIETRLLPTFETIEVEAKEIEEKTLDELSSRFNPDTMCPSTFYEDAYFTGAEHYWIYEKMKNDFLNMVTVWLYHLFEQDCNEIFSEKKWVDRKAKLTTHSILTTNPSNFYKINKELQYICNINKHGDGDSQTRLLALRPDLFDNKTKYNFDTENITIYTLKNISLEQIKEYSEYMKSFWIELYNKSH